MSHSYDGDGNETTVNGQAASYDWENRLVGLGTAQNPTATASYLYDADGNRVSATAGGTTTDYLVDTTVGFPSVVEERSTSGSLLARYTLGDDLIRMDRSGVASYYVFDGLGSTRALTNSSGAVTDSYVYDAYGEQVTGSGSTANAFRFDAQQLDGGTGDYFLRARYYSQSDGRFLSQDPFGGRDEDPASLHRYLYASDDPADMVDPGGGDDLGDVLISTSIANSIASIKNDVDFEIYNTVSNDVQYGQGRAVAGFALGAVLRLAGPALAQQLNNLLGKIAGGFTDAFGSADSVKYFL